MAKKAKKDKNAKPAPAPEASAPAGDATETPTAEATAEKLAELTDAELSKLPPAEQEEKLEAFEAVVDGVKETRGQRLAREAASSVTNAQQNAKARKRDIIRRFKDTLNVKLDEHELATIAGRGSRTWDAVVAAEKKLKEDSAALRNAVKIAKLEHSKIMDSVSTGMGTAEVECVDILDWEKKLVFTERLDVDEDDDLRIISRRAMTEDERQYPLKIDGAPIEPDPVAAAQIIAGLAERFEAPKTQWHRKGDVCKQAGCRRQHVTDPEVLKRAGITPEDAPASEAPAAAEETPAPEGETIAPVIEPPAAEGETTPAPTETNDAPEESSFRGEHEDRSVCYDDACTLTHGISRSTMPVEGWRGRHPQEEYRGRHTELDGDADGNCYVAACTRLHTTGVPPNEAAPDITQEAPRGEA
jgi:hypothetical protein